MDERQARTDAFRELARARGFHAVGIADLGPLPGADYFQRWVAAGLHGGLDYLVRHVDLRVDPRALLPSARSAVVVALSYAQPNPPRPGFPRIARYALGRDYHRVIRRRLAGLARTLQAEVPDAEFRACVDSAPLLERELAQRAGLGWFGKNTLLINSARGSWFLLGVLLTSLDLVPDAPATGGCGTCRLCVDACPTGAIQEFAGRWAVDAGQCLSTWTIERAAESRPSAIAEASGNWTFGCDICQEVCPFNQPRARQPERGGPPSDPELRQRGELPTLHELVSMTDAQWDIWTQGRPVRRATYAGLKLSARINLKHESGQPGTGLPDEDSVDEGLDGA